MLISEKIYSELSNVRKLDFRYCLICDNYYDGPLCECAIELQYHNLKETIKDLEKKIGDYLTFRDFGYIETPCLCDRKAFSVFIFKVGGVHGLYCKECGAWIKWLCDRELKGFKDCGVDIIG